MTAARQFLLDVLTPIYRPPPRSRLEDWAEANIVLRPKESIDFPGPYRKHRSIYAPRLLDAFVDDPQWRSLVIEKSSQSALTLHVLILVCRWISIQAGNILYAINSANKARDLSKMRLRPMLEDCKATRLMVEENEDDMANLSYDLPNAAVWLVGSHSAGNFASNPCSLAVGDELDKWPDLPGEAHGWQLMLQRVKKAEAGKAIGFSTPTTEDNTTHKGFLTGSRHRYFVPCPHCGSSQALEFEQVRFSHCKDLVGDYDLDRVAKETFYECEVCREPIHEHHKEDMLAAGEWRPTNHKELTVAGEKQRIPAWNPGEMSAHISDLYSTHPQSTWGRIAVEFLLAAGDSGKLHDWENGRMGRPVKKTVSNITAQHVLRLRSDYQRGRLPVLPCVAAMAIDNQGDHQKWVKGAFLPNGDLYVVDWGKTLDLREADKLVEIPIPTPEREITVQRVVIDEGGKGGTSYDVRTFCYPRFPKFFPAKGRGGLQVRHTVVFTESSLNRGGLEKIPVCHFDDDGFKRALYFDRIKHFDRAKVEEYHLPRLHLPQDVSEAFVRELCSEQLRKITDSHGVPNFEWSVEEGPNDWGDCVKMLLVLWNVIGSHFSPVQPARAE